MASFGERLRAWIGEKIGLHRLRGFVVVVDNTRPDVATAAVLERLDEALELIERHQPWRLGHLRRDLKQIRVMRFPCRGAYFKEQRVCMVELTFLARRDIGPATVAATIVHEGMHARVDRFTKRATADMAPTGRDPKAREERICRRAELEFGQSLPPEIGAPVVQRALDSLALADADVAPDIDWSEALRRQSDIDSGR